VEELTNESLFVWKEMMEEFKNKWQDIKRKKRIEIHVNSISVSEMKRMSMEKFLQRENSQISRIFAVKDPLVDVIYVSPF
jgi:IQ domain-containing protein H